LDRDAKADLLERLPDPDESRLDVPRILRGLEEERVHAAAEKPDRLATIALDELGERHSPGHGDRLRGRTHRARDEPRSRDQPRRLARHASGRLVDLLRSIGEA